MISQFLRSECCDAPIHLRKELGAWDDYLTLCDYVSCTKCHQIIGTVTLEDRWEWIGVIYDDTV